MALSAYSRDMLLDYLLNTESVTRPTSWYVSLHTGDPGTTGANEVAAQDDDYVRQAVDMGAASSGTSVSEDSQTWTAASDATTYTVTHIGIWDSASGGEFLFGGALPVPETVVASGSLVLAAGRCIARLI